MASRDGKPLIASCHCAGVQLVIPRKPRVITRCNCSYCHRLDPWFAYFARRTIRFSKGSDLLEGYAWGRRLRRWFRCGCCGAFVYHAPIGRTGPAERLGINMRLVPPGALHGATVKLRDGASGTWRLL